MASLIIPAQLKILDELAELNTLDEGFRPTEHAGATATDLITSLYCVSASFPLPSIAPDGDGGILLNWENKARILRLVIPDSPQRKGYLYHEDGQSYSAEYDLSIDSIKFWLRWLIRNEQ
jgi:hypothetical protein